MSDIQSHYDKIPYSECFSIVKYFTSPSKSCILVYIFNIVNIRYKELFGGASLYIMRFHCMWPSMYAISHTNDYCTQYQNTRVALIVVYLCITM